MALIVERFQGARSPSRTSINSLVCYEVGAIIRRGEEIRESIGRRETEGDTERKEADQLFSKFAAYELAFAYLLF